MMDGLELPVAPDPDRLDMAAIFADYIQDVRRASSVQPADTAPGG
jgi:hypothetical protein